MKRTSFTLSIILMSFVCAFAQKIEERKIFGGYEYLQNGETLKMKEMVQVMESHQQAHEMMKKARGNNTMATVLAMSGGGLIGWTLGGALAGGEANWTLAGVGAGFVIIALPVSSTSKKQTRRAVELYNASLNTSSVYQFRPKFNLVSNTYGLGLVISF